VEFHHERVERQGDKAVAVCTNPIADAVIKDTPKDQGYLIIRYDLFVHKVILTRVFELTHNRRGDVSRSEDGDFGGGALLNDGHGSFGRHVSEESKGVGNERVSEESKGAGNERDRFGGFEHVHVHKDTLGGGGQWLEQIRRRWYVMKTMRSLDIMTETYGSDSGMLGRWDVGTDAGCTDLHNYRWVSHGVLDRLIDKNLKPI